MKKFKFSLRAVRELREAREQSAQKTYADAVRDREAAAARLTALDRDLQEVWQGIRNRVVAGMRADQMRQAHGWRLKLEENQKQLVLELETCRRQLEVAHDALQLATRQREALDRVYRRQRRKHEHEARVEDQRFLDGIATRGAWRGIAQPEAA